MHDYTRRALLQGGTALATAGALTGPALLDFAKAWAQSAPWKAEPGAKLTVMRWKRFVPAEDDAFNVMVAAFKSATGTEMNVFSESFEDVQPKASVAANTGSGLDLAWGLHTLPQLFPTKVLKMNDVADYLGKKYGGWTDAAAKTCKLGDDWLGIPVATVGGYLTYRKSAVEKAGFKEVPADFPAYLELCKALKANNTPAGFALGHATGDANAWVHNILWGHGAYTVDKDDKVIINSPETMKALEYAKKLVEMARPTGIEEKTWQTAVLGPAHGVIGFVYLQKAMYEEAEGEFDQTVKINPKDQMAWYRYGVASTKRAAAAQGLINPAYDEVNKNTTLGPDRDAAVAKRDAIVKDFDEKSDKAIDKLISAVALPDANIAKAARATLESLYNPKHNNSNAGLDELIEKRRAELK